MNPDVPAILQEIHQTRLLMQREKDVLKTEVNPVHRVKRSWHQHQTAWMSGAAAVAGLLAFAIIAKARKKRQYGPLRTQYVVVGPPPPKKGVLGALLGVGAMLAKPALLTWLRQKAAEQFAQQPQQGPSMSRR